jgi:large subunit ribosomal protein L10
MEKTQRIEKQKAVTDLKAWFEQASSVVVADYTGITVKEMTALRNQLRAAKTSFRVAKNTLTALAISGTPYEGLKDYLKGPVILAFAPGPVDVAKILVKFSKDSGKLALKAAFFEGQVVGPEMIKQMSALPSREELLARVVGGLKAPLSNTVFVLSGIYRKFVYALSEIKNKKEKEG